MESDVLWLGLHKTGTTFLQKSLNFSQGMLSEAGIYYVTLDTFRHRWTRPLLHENHPEAPIPAHLPDSMRHWLVFDENILALVQHSLTRQGFYPKASERARIVANYLGLRRPRIILGLRNFVGFVPSLYCEALKSTPFKPFRSFLLQSPENMSWLPLVDNLSGAFPESEILLYCAEDLHGQEARLLATITDLPESYFAMLGGPERLGFSHEAVMRLHAMAANGPVDRSEVQATVRAWPRSLGQQGFSPWTAQERAILEASYARDIDTLRISARDPSNQLCLIDLGA
jgi:hypothetical protein